MTSFIIHYFDTMKQWSSKNINRKTFYFLSDRKGRSIIIFIKSSLNLFLWSWQCSTRVCQLIMTSFIIRHLDSVKKWTSKNNNKITLFFKWQKRTLYCHLRCSISERDFYGTNHVLHVHFDWLWPVLPYLIMIQWTKSPTKYPTSSPSFFFF